MAEPPTPPAPPPPPEGDGTPDAGNPGHAVPPEVKPKPGRATEKDRKAPSPPRRKAAPKSSPAPKPPAPRRAARPKPVAPKRPQPARRDAAVPTEPERVDTRATDPQARTRGRWFAGLSALAAGAALLSLRSSSRRRKAHQADGTDSSESFAAGIADEGTIPDEPAER